MHNDTLTISQTHNVNIYSQQSATKLVIFTQKTSGLLALRTSIKRQISEFSLRVRLKHSFTRYYGITCVFLN